MGLGLEGGGSRMRLGRDNALTRDTMLVLMHLRER